jgi:hypothetical protein
MITENNYLRFKDASWFPGEEVINCQVGGAGGIGSWLCFFLSRIGYSVTCYDFDHVEEHNLGGQLFQSGAIGVYKTVAIESVINSFSSNFMFNPIPERITKETPGCLISFSAFDNMEAREILFNNWLTAVDEYINLSEEEKLIISCSPIFIDGRLEAEQLQIFTCVFHPDLDIFRERVAKYQNTLFLDGEGQEPPCTLKQTSHVAAMIATNMVSIFTNHYTNFKENFELRVVPFYYEQFIPAYLTMCET